MVAAHHDGQRACREDLAHGRLGTLIVAAWRREISDYIAAIDEADIVTLLQQRAVDVEIIVARRTHDAVGRLTDRCWRVRLIIGEIGGRIGGAIRHAEHGDIGFEVVEVHREFGIEQRLMSGLRWHRERFRHDLDS